MSDHERRRTTIKQWMLDNISVLVLIVGFIFTWVMWISKIPAMSEQLDKDICPRVINLEKTNAVFIEKLDNVDKTLMRIERILERNKN